VLQLKASSAEVNIYIAPAYVETGLLYSLRYMYTCSFRTMTSEQVGKRAEAVL